MYEILLKEKLLNLESVSRGMIGRKNGYDMVEWVGWGLVFRGKTKSDSIRFLQKLFKHPDASIICKYDNKEVRLLSVSYDYYSGEYKVVSYLIDQPKSPKIESNLDNFKEYVMEWLL